MEQPDTPEVQESAEVTTDSPELELTTDTPEEDDSEEEFEGLTVRGKKAEIERLKSERLMQADYTRKTQTVAEERKSIESQKESMRQQAQFQQQNIQAVARITAIDEQLAQFRNLNWDALSDSDPVQAQKLDRQVRNLQDQRSQVATYLSQAQQQQALSQQQETAKLAEQAADYLRREVPNWTPARDQAVAEYALKSGIPAAALPNVIMHMPAFGVALHKAELYDQLVAKRQAKPKPEAQEKPVTRLTAVKSTANVNPDKLNSEDWLKWRNAQLKRN